jgi:hypothetical protein
MNEYIIDKDHLYIYLDSRNAIRNDSTANNQVKFDFAEPINIDRQSIKVSPSVSQFTSANSIYNINRTNSQLDINVNGTIISHNFDYGKYNASNFKSAFNKAFNGITMTFNSISGKFEITNSIYSFEILSSSTIGEIMGFEDNTNYQSIENQFIFPFMCNFNGILGFNIHIININTFNISSFTNSRSNIIQMIPIIPENTLIKYEETSHKPFQLIYTQMEYIELEIRDLKNNLIDFNNQPWNMTLCFTIIKEIDNTSQYNSFQSIVRNGRFF